MKVCAKCNSEKQLSEYYKDSAKKDGLSSYCKPCRIIASTKWHSENTNRAREIRAKWRVSNPDKSRESSAKWIRENPDKRKESIEKWIANNPEKVRANSRIQCHTRRARIRGLTGSLSAGLADRLFKLQRGKCACCGEPLGSDYHLDHIMPLALGGTNTDDNIQLLRSICNKQKHAKNPIDFMQQKGFLL